MKRKRFSVEQIVAVLKQAELGMPVAAEHNEPGALHPGDGLGHGRARMAKAVGDARPQRDDAIFFEFEDGLEIHLRGVDQVTHPSIVSSQVSLTFLHPLANLVQVPNPADPGAQPS